jgi:hypothetical protein
MLGLQLGVMEVRRKRLGECFEAIVVETGDECE